VVGRIDRDPVKAPPRKQRGGVLRPGRPAIDAAEDADPDVHTGRRSRWGRGAIKLDIAFARSGIEYIRVALGDRQGADGQGRLVVPERGPCIGAVVRPPDPAPARANEDPVCIVGCGAIAVTRPLIRTRAPP